MRYRSGEQQSQTYSGRQCTDASSNAITIQAQGDLGVLAEDYNDADDRESPIADYAPTLHGSNVTTLKCGLDVQKLASHQSLHADCFCEVCDGKRQAGV